MAPTEVLYLDNASLNSTDTQIVSYKPLSSLNDAEKLLAKNVPMEQSYAVITKQTVFYPQGGGQASDTGRITRTQDSTGTSNSSKDNFEVLLVRKTSDGAILHFGLFPSTTVGGTSITPQP